MTPAQDISTAQAATNRAFNLALLSHCWQGMTPSESLRDLFGRGVAPKPYEAVAIAQQLIASGNIDGHQPSPPALLSLDNVRLGADGSVACGGCVPRVPEIGMLLAEMLPCEGTVRVPGALRYAIARSLSQVEAPPFDSVTELSAALARHEQGDRVAVLRDLYVRAAPKPRKHDAPGAERRRRTPSVATLRRQLREADEELFRQLNRTVAAPVAPPLAPSGPAMAGSFILHAESAHGAAPDGRFNAARWALAAMAALSIAFGTGYTVVAGLRAMQAARPSTSAAAPAPPPTAAPATEASRQSSRSDGISEPDPETARSGNPRSAPSRRPSRSDR